MRKIIGLKWSMPGIEPRTSVSVGEHATPNAKQLPSILAEAGSWRQNNGQQAQPESQLCGLARAEVDEGVVVNLLDLLDAAAAHRVEHPAKLLLVGRRRQVAHEQDPHLQENVPKLGRGCVTAVDACRCWDFSSSILH